MTTSKDIFFNSNNYLSNTLVKRFSSFWSNQVKSCNSYEISNVAREPVDFLKVVRLFLCVMCINYRNKPKIINKVEVDLSGSTFQNKNKIKQNQCGQKGGIFPFCGIFGPKGGTDF